MDFLLGPFGVAAMDARLPGGGIVRHTVTATPRLCVTPWSANITASGTSKRTPGGFGHAPAGPAPEQDLHKIWASPFGPGWRQSGSPLPVFPLPGGHP